MLKRLIRTSIFVCFIWYVESCGITHRISYYHSQEWQQTTVQDSSGKKTIQETMRKSTKITAEAEVSKKLAGK